MKRKRVPWFDTERLGKEFKDFCTLISLKLYNLTKILTFNNSSVACEILFESFQNSLLIIFRGDTLDSSQRLSTVALLNTNVNVILQ